MEPESEVVSFRNDSFAKTEAKYEDVHSLVIRRSNQKLQTLPPPPPPPFPGNPGHLTISCARGVGNLTAKAFLGVGNSTFARVGWAKLSRKCPVFFGRRSR